jgi:hypothetical protein
MIIDACQQHQDKITNELDINTMKDVMQVIYYYHNIISESIELIYITPEFE